MKWFFYGLLFLFAMVLDTVVFPALRLFGVTLRAVPTAAACIAVREGAERGGLFGLLAGIFFCLSGTDCGSIYLVTLTVSCVLSGLICDRYYTRTFVPSLLLSLGALALCEGAAFLFRLYLGTVQGALFSTVLLPELFYSLIAFPLFYLGAWAISKLGGNT